MSSYPPPGPGGVGQRIEETVEFLEAELRRTIAFLNDAIVPQVRAESIGVIRTASDKLRELADRFEKSRGTRS